MYHTEAHTLLHAISLRMNLQAYPSRISTQMHPKSVWSYSFMEMGVGRRVWYVCLRLPVCVSVLHVQSCLTLGDTDHSTARVTSRAAMFRRKSPFLKWCRTLAETLCCFSSRMWGRLCSGHALPPMELICKIHIKLFAPWHPLILRLATVQTSYHCQWQQPFKKPISQSFK